MHKRTVQTNCLQAGHSTISGQGHGHTQTEAQTQLCGNPISIILEQAATNSLTRAMSSKDAHLLRPSSHRFSGLVIAFGSNCKMRFGAPIVILKTLGVLPSYSAGFFLHFFCQCVRLFFPFFPSLKQAVSSLRAILIVWQKPTHPVVVLENSRLSLFPSLQKHATRTTSKPLVSGIESRPFHRETGYYTAPPRC